jgi:hypothetical protein
MLRKFGDIYWNIGVKDKMIKINPLKPKWSGPSIGITHWYDLPQIPQWGLIEFETLHNIFYHAANTIIAKYWLSDYLTQTSGPMTQSWTVDIHDPH